MDKDEIISCKNCIHYNICSLWSTSDLVDDEAHKGCFGHFANEKDYYKSSEDIVIVSREAWEKSHQERARLYKDFQEVKRKTTEEVLQELKKMGTIHTEYDWNDYLKIDMDKLKAFARKRGINLEDYYDQKRNN